MAKKHCPRHYRFVATCPDCRVLNDEPAFSDDEPRKRLYQDAEPQDSASEEQIRLGNAPSPRARPEIPRSDDRIPPSGYGNRSPPRFQYTRPSSRNPRKISIIILVILGLFTLIIGLYGYPLWHARVLLQTQLYENKSDIDFWDVYTMNFWSVNFFFNKIGLIGAIIAAIIMSLPPEDNILTLIGTRFGWGRPSKKKALIFWWTIGFGIFFVIGQALETGYFGLVMYSIDKGSLDAAGSDFFNAFRVLRDPNAVSMVDIYLYSAVTYPILIYICVLILIRCFFNILNYSLVIKSSLKSAAHLCFIIGLLFLMGLFGAILMPLDGVDLMRINSVLLGAILFFIIGIVLLILGNRLSQQDIYNFTQDMKKKTVISAGVTIFIILVPVFASIPSDIAIQSNREIWEDLVWNVQISREIKWSRQAAGIDVGEISFFEERDISQYVSSLNDQEIIEVMRQYDKDISARRMIKEIRSANSTMADSDIIYVPGKGEFWVAPKTLQIEIIEQSNVNKHTELYDHVDGFIALDTSTGEPVAPEDYIDIFGVPSNHPIFFGEAEDQTYRSGEDNITDTGILTPSVAYDNDILLNTGWKSEGNHYQGEPDGTLTGLEAFWFTMNMGLTDYALNGEEKAFLINRNIKTRVQAVLLPGLVIDNDPYLVFDRENGKMFYAVSIYTQIALGSYAKSNILRFLGVVLVDVKTGELTWYANPSLPMVQNDPTSMIWRVYMSNDVYPWQPAPDWLKQQLRYPENLWEEQLRAHYVYHVQNPEIWKKGNEFFKRPKDENEIELDTFFIETDLASGLEFVGVDLVEYSAEETEKLAGLYVIRHGEFFGQTVFYSSSELFGPITARKQFSTYAAQDFTLLGDYRYGNILLYPLAGSLYYFIPVYSTSNDYESLRLAGLINAYDNSKIYWGTSVSGAYQSLKTAQGIVEPEPPTESDEFTLDVTGPSQLTFNSTKPAEFRLELEYLEYEVNLPRRNITLNLTIQGDQAMNVSLFSNLLTGFQYTFDTINRYNFTIAEYNDTTGLYPGEGRIFTVKINPALAFAAPELSIGFKFDIIDIDTGEFIVSSGWASLKFINPNWT